MDPKKRHFINHLPDYTGGEVSIDTEAVKKRVLDYVRDISTDWEMKPWYCDGGLYIGIAGAAYTYHRLACVPQLASERERLLDLTREILPLITKYISTRRQELAGYLLGNAGVFAVAAIVYKELNNMEESKVNLDNYIALAPKVTPIDFLDCGSDELMVGRAGYLAGVLWLRSTIGGKILEDKELFPILDITVESGQKYSEAHQSPIPLMYQYYETEYLGAAHGIAGILTMLLSFPEWLSKRPESKTLIRKSLDALLKLQQPNGNFPACMNDVRGIPGRKKRDDLIHWCHGAPGFVYMLAKAYLVYEDQKYLDSALRCGQVTWEKGLLVKGPGICHGVSNSGYVFLTLYRLTKDPKHFHRAIQFYHFLHGEEFKQANPPDCRFSLFEGMCGIVCFVADLLNPLQATFPLFDFI